MKSMIWALIQCSLRLIGFEPYFPHIFDQTQRLAQSSPLTTTVCTLGLYHSLVKFLNIESHDSLSHVCTIHISGGEVKWVNRIYLSYLSNMYTSHIWYFSSLDGLASFYWALYIYLYIYIYIYIYVCVCVLWFFCSSTWKISSLSEPNEDLKSQLHGNMNLHIKLRGDEVMASHSKTSKPWVVQLLINIAIA